MLPCIRESEDDDRQVQGESGTEWNEPNMESSRADSAGGTSVAGMRDHTTVLPMDQKEPSGKAGAADRSSAPATPDHSELSSILPLSWSEPHTGVFGRKLRTDMGAAAAATLSESRPIDRPRLLQLPALPVRTSRASPRARFDLSAIPRIVYLALALLLGVTVAEILTAYGDPRLGVGMHIALLALIVWLSASIRDQRHHAFLLALMIAPLIRIVSTGMPLHSFSQPYWYLLTSIPLFIAAFLIARQLGLSASALKLRLPRAQLLPIELMVWGTGVGLGYVEWRILRPAPLVNGHSAAWIIEGGIILLICTGLVEELLFRGLIQHVGGVLFGRVPGILYTVVLFAALHIGHLSWTDVFFVACVGLYFGVVAEWTRSLLGVTLAHGTINIMLFIVLPLGLIA
jgi:membrane protease YdiL (CAAX protease family)